MAGLAGIHGFESFQGLEGVRRSLSKMTSGQAWDDGMCAALGPHAHVWAEDALSDTELSFQKGRDPERWRHMWSLTVLGLWLERHGLT